jgi:hypothetical protein
MHVITKTTTSTYCINIIVHKQILHFVRIPALLHVFVKELYETREVIAGMLLEITEEHNCKTHQTQDIYLENIMLLLLQYII